MINDCGLSKTSDGRYSVQGSLRDILLLAAYQQLPGGWKRRVASLILSLSASAGKSDILYLDDCRR